jgi:hypothetical protein
MKNKLYLLAFLCLSIHLSAQESEPGGIWTSISAEKDLTKKWSVGGEIELRTIGFTTDRDRIGIQIGTDYEFFKNLKLGLSYSWMNVDDDYKFSDDSIRTDFFQNRHRFNAQASWKFKLGDFGFQFRERAQTTLKDDSNRLKEDGSINTNRINPEYVWRNRLKVSYGTKDSDWEPYVSIETYFLLNDPEEIRFYNSDQSDFSVKNQFFSKIRYTAGIEYKINKRHKVELYGIYSHERGAEEQVVPGPNYYAISDWIDDYVLGLAWSIKL